MSAAAKESVDGLHGVLEALLRSGTPMKDENEAKGYARGENDNVILTNDGLENFALDAVKTIEIEQFGTASPSSPCGRS